MVGWDVLHLHDIQLRRCSDGDYAAGNQLHTCTDMYVQSNLTVRIWKTTVSTEYVHSYYTYSN